MGEGEQISLSPSGERGAPIVTDTTLNRAGRPLSQPSPLKGRGLSPLRYGIALAACILALDQLSKWVTVGPLALPNRASIELLPIFRLIWVENYGVSMGFLTADGQAGRWLLTGLTAAIATAVAIWLWREQRMAEALALGAILGGALGNILDRVRLGYVADFLNLHFGAWSPFLVFNVADAAISLGVVILVALRPLLDLAWKTWERLEKLRSWLNE